MNSLAIPASLNIRGIRLLNLALEEAVDAIDAALAARQATRIGFINADCVNIAATNAAYRDTLAALDWLFIDGSGMRIAGRVLRRPVRDNVNGTDLFPRLCARLAGRGTRVFFYGGRPGVAAAAAAWAQAYAPGLQVAGVLHGYQTPEAAAATPAIIRASGAELVLVALGVPRQEAWLLRHLEASGATVAIGVGGLFDYYSGRIPRAPLWLRRLGLEWTFRLLQEPQRLARRYLVGNPLFLFRIGGDWLRQRLSPPAKPGKTSVRTS